MSKICFVCQQEIKNEMITALGNEYCLACFKCSICNKNIQGFFVIDNKPVCKEDYESRLPKCNKCQTPVKGSKLTDNQNNIYHPQCFSCNTCNNLITASYFILNNKVECGTCYQTQKDQLKKQSIKEVGTCQNCKKSIQSDQKCIIVGPMERYHLDGCFKCVKCRKDLQSQFIVVDAQRKTYACVEC
ncbi:hypothetical protein DLAC_03867 [Tieghemostelium lacteum]|uniref:LIM zinc-binding domain-containing protein n=1 Tax=Tieghemostelium lacteum TaxID=361077 RepID=A0A152A0W7_TIELA|nr:hypothetical protein DLAC_03867 [Tieghemostelium lacteum]|eukprot:KYQ99902.1 hypothetical protein DLAC_03867 [Tieghemostelium lacteum]